MTRFFACGALVAWLPFGAALASPVVRPLGQAQVDWTAGTVTADGASAAELRLPDANLARPGAERRARARALGTLREALAALPKAGVERPDAAAIDLVLQGVKTTRTEYLSDGGALVTLLVDLGGLTKTFAPHPVSVAAPGAPLELTPAIACGRQEVEAGRARYSLDPPPADALPLAVKNGRLRLQDRPCRDLERVAGAELIVHIGRPEPVNP